jgi:hypothetical protein
MKDTYRTEDDESNDTAHRGGALVHARGFDGQTAPLGAQGAGVGRPKINPWPGPEGAAGEDPC